MKPMDSVAVRQLEERFPGSRGSMRSMLALAPPEGYMYCGPTGAGHFVKMVHNGIEYGMTGAIDEGIEALKTYEKTFGFDVKEAVKVYAHGSIIESKMMAWLWQAYAIPGFMKNNTQIMLRNFYLNYLKKNLKHI